MDPADYGRDKSEVILLYVLIMGTKITFENYD